MIKTTRWENDTCGCVVDFTWDTDDPLETRTFTISDVVRACPAHDKINNKTTHWNTILTENRSKNRVYGKIEELLPGVIEMVDGKPTGNLLGGRSFTWTFDATRNLIVTLVNFSEAEKTTIRTAAAEISNKIVIQ